MSPASDRRVLVTGAARGIGAATARAFAAAGADVAIVDVDPGPEGAQVVADIEAAGRRGLAIQADLTTVEQCRHAVASAVTFLGGIDVLVNNAGGNLGIYATFEELSEDQFDRILSLNLKSTFFVSQAAIPHLRKRPGGRIINLASELVWVGYELMPAYVAAKGAVVALTRSMARAAAPGVTVNAVAPGPTATERFKRGKWYREEKERREADIPLGRFGEPEDIARFIVSLAGDTGDWCTGQTFHANGGVVMP
ncbi:MAG: SDR family NAD(P)-dependent oxidoreductase [Acidimicrobiia bacterium]